MALVLVEVTYRDYGNDGIHVIDGYERAELVGTHVTWHEALVLSGERTGTKRTSEPGGFTVSASLAALASPNFQATGTLTTVLDGRTYTQPRNGT